MSRYTLVRHVIGYCLGFLLFFLGIPYLLFLLSHDPQITAALPWLGRLPVGPTIRLTLALAIGAIGLTFVVWSNAALLIRGEGGALEGFGIAISPRTRHLVVTGPYRYTRNPMIFGAFSFYLALSIYWNSPAAFTVVLLCLIPARIYLWATEERRLLKDFGHEYEQYRSKVGAIIPHP